jgi:UDP-glucuronate decarboxylase
MNRVLITGGAGFLGSHLCDRLMKAGDDVLCVDNYFTGSKANIALLIGLEVRSYHHLLGR